MLRFQKHTPQLGLISVCGSFPAAAAVEFCVASERVDFVYVTSVRRKCRNERVPRGATWNPSWVGAFGIRGYSCDSSGLLVAPSNTQIRWLHIHQTALPQVIGAPETLLTERRETENLSYGKAKGSWLVCDRG